jgi:hypothetical protein
MDFKTIDPYKVVHDKEIRKMFVAVYNSSGIGTIKECDNCPGAFHNAIVKYQNKHKMNEKKYVLKNDKVLFFNNNHYVNANLTDEIGEAAVKAGYKDWFLKIPNHSEGEFTKTQRLALFPDINLKELKKEVDEIIDNSNKKKKADGEDNVYPDKILNLPSEVNKNVLEKPKRGRKRKV